MKKTQLFPIVGFILGWGAPLGAIALRMTWGGPLSLFESAGQEWSRNVFLYWYMLLGTCGVMTFIGFLLGKRDDRILFLQYRMAHQVTLSGERPLQALLESLGKEKFPVSCLRMELDLFAGLRQSYGRAYGDIFLEDFFRGLEECLRPGDLCARYGEGEFILILPLCDEQKAGEVASRIREKASELFFPLGRLPVKITVSLGAATLYSPSELGGLFEETAKNLKEAQRRGKDQTVLSLLGKAAGVRAAS